MSRTNEAIDTLTARLNGFDGQLTAREEQIASVLCANLSSVARDSITTIAARAGVEKSAISRFSKKLGYARYTDLRDAAWQAALESADQSDGHSGQTAFEAAFKAAQQTSADAFAQVNHEGQSATMKRAATLVASADRLAICGVGHGRLLARPFSLGLAGKGKTLTVQDSNLKGVHAISAKGIATWHKPGDLLVLLYIPTRASAGKNRVPDPVEIPDHVGPVLYLTTRNFAPEVRAQDVVLQILCSDKPATIATTIVTCSVAFAQVCLTGSGKTRGCAE
jgi:DNA-binding MurR/RpiR family transcriptional regulator